MRFKAPNKLVITLFLLILFVSWLPSTTQALAIGSDSASQGHEAKVSPTITVEEVEALVNLLPAVKERRQDKLRFRCRERRSARNSNDLSYPDGS